MKYTVTDKSGYYRGLQVVSFTVASKFGTKDSFVATLILMNRASNNLFYEKHVLRLGENSEDMLEIRQNIGSIPVGRMGEALDRVGVISGNQILVKGAPASTMLRLDKIDLKLAMYTIANAFVEAMLNNQFGDYDKSDSSKNSDVSVTFPSVCIEQLERDGSADMGKTMIIGGSRTSKAQGDPVKVTFDINHCSGTGG